MDFFNMLSGSKIIKTEGTKIQSDYAQNDPGAKDYIKNRPFYSEITNEIDTNIIPSQEVDGETLDGMLEGYLGFILDRLDSDSEKKLTSIVDKGQYNLTIDGKTEQITTVYDSGIGGFLFGNLSILGVGEDTGETYIGAIDVQYSGPDTYRGTVTLVLQTTETTHTIGLSYIGDTVPIIPESTLTFSEEPGPDIAVPTGCTGAFAGNFSINIEEDAIYNFSLNGTTYKNLTFTTINDGEMYYFGNPALVNQGEDTGEEYIFMCTPLLSAVIIYCTLPAGDYAVSFGKSLVKTIETIHKMDSKYIDVPYTKDDEGNVIFEKDIYVNEVNVSQSLEQISEDREETNTKLSEIEKSVIEQEKNNAKVKNIVEDFPRPLIKGLIVGDNVANVPYGLSAGSGYPNGVFAWSEGSSGATPNQVSYSTDHKLIIEKDTTIDSYIQYTMVQTIGAWTAEQHIENLNKYHFLKIKFYGEQKTYFVKFESATAENLNIKIRFSFLSYEDKFDISEPTSGRRITELETIEALGNYSHSEGELTKAKGKGAHSEGYVTYALGDYSHAEGYNTTASGDHSHAEGYRSEASGTCSHAEGENTKATGGYSHAEGQGTKASGRISHVQGKYNIEDTENKYAHIVGNGESDTKCSNAHTLDWDGNAWYAGTTTTKDIIIESTDGTVIIESLLATIEDLKSRIEVLENTQISAVTNINSPEGAE